MKRLGEFFLLFCVTFLLAACSAAIPQPLAATLTPTEDTIYLTPIPQATIDAYKWDQPATTKLEAAIVAIKNTMIGHFSFTNLPKVLSVEKISIADAQKRVSIPLNSSYDTTHWNDEVWFVVLEGEIQIYPPPPPGNINATLPPPFHGCNFYMFDVKTSAGGELGSITCPADTP